MTNLQRLIAETTVAMGKDFERRGRHISRANRYAYFHLDAPRPCFLCELGAPHSGEMCAAIQIMPAEVN